MYFILKPIFKDVIVPPNISFSIWPESVFLLPDRLYSSYLLFTQSPCKRGAGLYRESTAFSLTLGLWQLHLL